MSVLTIEIASCHCGDTWSDLWRRSHKPSRVVDLLVDLYILLTLSIAQTHSVRTNSAKMRLMASLQRLGGDFKLTSATLDPISNL